MPTEFYRTLPCASLYFGEPVQFKIVNYTYFLVSFDLVRHLTEKVLKRDGIAAV